MGAPIAVLTASVRTLFNLVLMKPLFDQLCS